MNIKNLLIVLTTILTVGTVTAKEYRLTSPDGKIEITVNDGASLSWSVNRAGEGLIDRSAIRMKVRGHAKAFGENSVAGKVTRRSVDEWSEAVVPTKFRRLHDRFNEMTLNFKEGFSVIFRAYDNGAAYRFASNLKGKEIFVETETAEFNFAGDFKTYWPREENPDFISHQEAFFDFINLSQTVESKYAYMPLYVTTPKGTAMVVMESDLSDYPNMFLFGGNGTRLSARFPEVVLDIRNREGKDRDEQILKKADYIAATDAKREFPWRILTINEDDRGLLENYLVYQLAHPEVTTDNDWIRPGKISWDWWATLNVYGVDFEAGVNTETYKYFIDFASRYGVEYILLDEGWSAGTLNIKEARPEVDIRELVRYGESKGVGLVLWTLWKPLGEDLEEILDIYRDWGIKGIKVDFMQRSDQWMVNYYERVGREAHKRKLLVDFHGSFKPAGLQRKYPNVMTFEGVYGMEHNKCSYDISPDHDLILPFTRMVAGPMDYTPGATVNASKTDFSEQWYHPMSQGTRAHQAAIFIVFESSLQMLCDSPSNYYKTPDYTSFIASIPTVWDETVALSARAGEHLAIARRNGENWYVGAMTNWTGRELELDLGFLPAGSYKAVVFRDGVNANKYGSDYRIEDTVYSSGQKVTIKMADGGGWAAILTPVK